MNTMFYVLADLNGEEVNRIYYDHQEFISDSFTPAFEVKKIINFQLHGKTYGERKDSLECIAHDVQNYFYDSGTLTWMDLMILGDWFEKMGKRYGMLTEFRENGFC